MSTALINLLEIMTGCMRGTAAPETKICKYCNLPKPAEEFELRRGRTCLACRPVDSKKYRDRYHAKKLLAKQGE